MKEVSERTVGELAEVVQGRIYGDPQTVIRGIAAIEDARIGDITFAESIRFLQDAEQSHASAVIAPSNVEPNGGLKTLIRVDNPRLAFAQLLDLFAPDQYAVRGIHPTAVIGSDFRHGANVSIGANAVIGENVRIGNNVTIHPLVYLGDDVEIGDDTVVYPNCSLLHGTIVGSRCILHSGVTLGSDGYGYLTIGGKHRKIPQIGNVWIGNDVEIGANSTVDRARTGSTRIGDGTKLDNLVHVGHNCEIENDCLLIAQSALAGGVHLGHHVVIAGQAGVREQVKIGAGAILGARTGAMSDVAPGAFVSGYGAKPHKDVLRQEAAIIRLPELLKTVRSLEKRLATLEARESTDGGADD